MTTYIMKDGSHVSDPRLGRLKQFDEHSRQFGVISTLGSSQQTPRSYTWTVGQWLNQGQEGACVAFGFGHELIAEPIPVKGITDANQQAAYCGIQATDPWPGGSQHCPRQDPPFYEGTSVLAGAKYFTSLGYYSSYHWAFSEEELALAVGWKGPAVIGVNWYNDMFEPNAKGYLTPTGGLAGGHCTLIKAVNIRYGYYTIHNSWGLYWGNKGTARITRKDMATLLAQDGEVVVPDTRLVGPSATTTSA